MVDNTAAVGLARPLDCGADIIAESATKFINGHGNSIGGVIVDSGRFDWSRGEFHEFTDPDPSYHGRGYWKAFGNVPGQGNVAFVSKIRLRLLRDLGSCLSPFNAFLFLQGLKTLEPENGEALPQCSGSGEHRRLQEPGDSFRFDHTPVAYACGAGGDGSLSGLYSPLHRHRGRRRHYCGPGSGPGQGGGMKRESAGPARTECYRIPGEIELEHGDRLGGVMVAYETYGRQNQEKSNTILVCHALSGDAHAGGLHKGEEKPGWWDIIIGPSKALDTDKYFVICSNVLGGCKARLDLLSVNKDTGTGMPYGLGFPFITIKDMVDVQKRLLDHLGIDKLFAVVRGSFGGMQVLQWTISYPDMVRLAVPIAHQCLLLPLADSLQRGGPKGHNLRSRLERGGLLRCDSAGARALPGQDD